MRPALALAVPLALALAACSTPRGAPENRAALTEGVPFLPPNVALYVAEPLHVRPGQAVRYEETDGGRPDPIFLETSCVTGIVESELESARAAGRTLEPVIETRTRATADRYAALDDQEPPAFARGEASLRYLKDTRANKLRVVGSASVSARSNRFRLTGETRERSGPECGTHLVEVVEASRFLSYAVTVDFPSIASANDFRLAGGDGNVVSNAKPELAVLLKERGAKLTLRVYVSKGLAPIVAEKLKDVDCRVDNLAGCALAHRALMDAVFDITSVPGSAGTLESVLGPEATWNPYVVTIAEGSVVQ